MARTALITGAAVRIGRRIALALAREGWDIALHYNRSENEARRTAEDISAAGGACDLFQADLASFQQLETLVSRVLETFGRCDLLVNNASVFEGASLRDTEEALFDRAMAINLKAPFFLLRNYARAVESGEAINLLDTRIAGTKTAYFAYSLAKKALGDLTRMAARELGPDFRVNGICPGLVLAPEGQGPGYLERLSAKIPLRRPGEVDDVVRAVEYLLDNPFVTGEILFVDGGERLI